MELDLLGGRADADVDEVADVLVRDLLLPRLRLPRGTASERVGGGHAELSLFYVEVDEALTLVKINTSLPGIFGLILRVNRRVEAPSVEVREAIGTLAGPNHPEGEQE